VEVSSSPRLSVRSIAKAFGATQALTNVTLEILPGEVVALMGANGAGKSTLVNILAGVTPLDSGEIYLNGRPYSVGSPREGLEAGIATVHQSTDKVAATGLTVADALVLDRFADGSAPFFLSQSSVRRMAAAIAHEAGFDLPLDLDFGRLGPAERQLVAIARALSAKASVIILDEPTASLSRQETDRLFDVLATLRNRGIAILYISHRIGDLARLADRAVVLRGGAVVETFRRPIDFTAAVGAMIGRPLAAARARSRSGKGRAIFELRAVQLVPGATPIDLSLHNGEVVAITGPLGAGKSRLVKAIFGLEAFVAGSMLLDGKTFAPEGPSESIKAGVVLAGEDRHRTSFMPSDWLGGTVAATISLPHLGRWFPSGFLFGPTERQAAQAGIRRLGIRASGPQARIDTLSGGNQQKVVLARWQAEPTRLLLLDEPFQGVDVGARADIIGAIRAAQAGATLIVTSDPEEALEVADRIYTIEKHELSPWRGVFEQAGEPKAPLGT
jgi:simple sugar transport system ATP-binding protein